jgi:glutamate-1-semialdehyde 2,1-aminomutase
MTTNEQYRNELRALIPGGAHTYSRGDDQYPSNAPAILHRGEGAYVWDPNGNKYLDYGMALRAVTLGYANKRVNDAAIEGIKRGVNLTRATTIELEAAKLIVDLIPSADMVKFAKNGSNVTTAAVKLARAYTGKKFVCVPRQQPFFSFDDWFIGSTAIKKGIPEEHYATTLLFDYNDTSSLQRLFDTYPNQIAAVLMEPATTLQPTTAISAQVPTDKLYIYDFLPQRNFLHDVQDLCKKNGTIFIIDEMITGFRWHLSGAQTYFGLDPDISTFGKGMANGYAVSAMVGKKEIMSLGGIHEEGSERTFLLSTTHGAEMPGLSAFIETANIYNEQNVVEHLWKFGEGLFMGINSISETLDIKDYFYMEGNHISMNYVTKDNEGNINLAFRTLFSQEMLSSGVLMPWIAPSFAHTKVELDMTLNAVEKALIIYKKALKEGLSKYLNSTIIKPVFRKYN